MKLFRAYGLYNNKAIKAEAVNRFRFQSSFEFTGYITVEIPTVQL